MKPERWRQIDEVLQAALDRDPAERAAFLKEACAGDDLLRDEVESLIKSSERAGSFIETPAIEVDAQLIAGDQRESLIGRSVGHYQIVEQLGAGGMGEVYLALHTRTNRKVALKLLPAFFATDTQRVRRFQQEARAVLALNHPNIVTIYDLEQADHIHFIATELIEGETLRQRMARARMGVPEALDVAVQVASALAAAHKAGVIHRDIKPENVMIRPDGIVKVLDFGLAKLSEEADPRRPVDTEAPTKAAVVHTEPGIVMGTVNYMSPEQAQGQRVDEQTDVWSLGVVLYEMVAGRTPFAGQTTSHTIVSILEHEPAQLSRRAAGVPEDLERIVRKALKKEREERYQTAKDLLVDLERLRKQVEAQTEVERAAAANKLVTAETEIIKTEAGNSIAVLPFANLSAEAENEYFCDGLAEELLNALAKVEDLKVAARTSAFSLKDKNAQVSEIGRALGVRTVLEGSVRKSGNRLRITVQLVNAADGYHLWSERYDREMKDIFDVQDEITLAIVDALKVKLFGEEKAAVLKRYTENAEAYQLYLKGRYHWYKMTPENVRKSRDYFERAIDLDPTYALAYCGLADHHGFSSATGMLPPSEGWPKAEAAMAKALELDETLAEAYNPLAALKMIYHRDWTGAEREFKRGIELNPNFAEIHLLYAVYLVAMGRFDEAIAECRRALEIDPLSLRYNWYLGNLYYYARRYDEAVVQYGQALELDPNNAFVHEDLGNAYERKELHGEAIAAWQRAMTLAGDNELAAILGSTYAESGFGGAIRAVTRKRLEQLNERNIRGEYVPMIDYARAYVRLGDQEQAFHWLEKACEERNMFPLMIDSDPFYDSLRSDPRFEDLLRRIGLKADVKAQGESTNEVSEAPTLLLAPATTDKILSDAETFSKADTVSLSPSLPVSFSHRGWLLIASLSLLITAAGFFAYRSFTPNDSEQIEAIAVLPFANTGGDQNTEYLSDGIAESLIHNLSQIPRLRVMSRNSVFRYRGREANAQKVGKELSVGAVLMGNVRQVGDQLVINVELIDVGDGARLWGNLYTRKMADVITTQNDIAQAVASNLRLKLSAPERQQLAKRPTENVEAYQLYLKGRYHDSKLILPETQKGISYFQQAIGLDPNYALAYVGLARAHIGLALASEMPPNETFLKAKAAAQKAFEIDPALPEAHVALGVLAFWHDWDWAAAERHDKQALELDPDNAEAHWAYAHLLSNTGRHAEALPLARRNRELEPLDLRIRALEAQFLIHAGRTDEALTRLQEVFDLNPNFWMAHLFAASAYIEKGMYGEAVAAARLAKELSPVQTTSVAFGGYALARLGRRDEARAVLEELLKLSNERFVPPYHIALIYNGLGETDKALAWLEKGVEQRDPKMVFLKVEPKWNNLRSDPRFADLLRRVNLAS